MVELECPWCEEVLAVPGHAEEVDEGTCPYCLTKWTYVSPAEAELAKAA